VESIEICGIGIKAAAYQEPQQSRSRRKVHTRRLGDCRYGAKATFVHSLVRPRSG
jgi:hypothetical protein